MLSKEKLLPEPIKGLKENPFLDSYIIEFLDLPKNFKESDFKKRSYSKYERIYFGSG